MRQYLLSTLLLLAYHSLHATTYTAATVSELHDVVDIVVPGDTIIMANGTWRNAQITFDADGEEGNPIVLRAETPGEVVITGSVRFRIAGDYLVVSGLVFRDCISTETNLISFRLSSSDLSSHSRLTETVIIDCNPSNPTTDYKWVGIFGSHNEVDHCYIANKNHSGTTLVVWSTVNEGLHHVHHNFFGPRPQGDGNGFETIRVGTSNFAKNKGSNLIEHNYFYQTDGEIEIISGKSSYSTYRYNIFRDCRGGLTLRHGTNCTVEGNLFFGEGKSGSYGIRIIDRDHLVINNYMADLNHGSSSVRHPISIVNADAEPVASGYQYAIKDTIAYNTIINCTKGIMVGARSGPVVPDSCLIVTNVVTVDGSPPVLHNSTPTNITYDGNFFYRSDAAVTVPDIGYRDEDPLLSLPPGDSIYRPELASPIIGAAVSGVVPQLIDFEGHPRPATPSCGADEPSDLPAFDRGTYGPSWYEGDLPVSTLAIPVNYPRIHLVYQGNHDGIGLYYPTHDQQAGGSAIVTVFSRDGRLVLRDVIIRTGETIYLGDDWPADYYLIHCSYDRGIPHTLKWVKW